MKQYFHYLEERDKLWVRIESDQRLNWPSPQRHLTTSNNGVWWSQPNYPNGPAGTMGFANFYVRCGSAYHVLIRANVWDRWIRLTDANYEKVLASVVQLMKQWDDWSLN